MADTPVVIRTASDLFKALAEGRTPAINCSAIRFTGRSCGPVFDPDLPRAEDRERWDVLKTVLARVYMERGDAAETVRMMAARIAFQGGRGVEAVLNLPLPAFLAALAADSAPPDPGAPPTKLSDPIRSLLDDRALRIAQVAENRGMSLEDRLVAISSLDCRFWGKGSPELGELLDVTAGRIRQTDWWKVKRPKHLQADAVAAGLAEEDDF